MSHESDEDLVPCIAERLNKLIDFTPAARDSENLRAKCLKFWEEVGNRSDIEDILVNQKDKEEELSCPCDSENKRPFLTKLLELKMKGIDKVALAAENVCKYCEEEQKGGGLDDLDPDSEFNVTQCIYEEELPIECRSDLFTEDPYRVDRIITEPKVFVPNMYDDHWKLRHEKKEADKDETE